MKVLYALIVSLMLAGCAQNMLCQHFKLEKNDVDVHIEADCKVQTLPAIGLQ